jgi:formylglycine-generating enzyme required for sulfatase activity
MHEYPSRNARLSLVLGEFLLAVSLITSRCCLGADERPEAGAPAPTAAQSKWAGALKSRVEITSSIGLKMRLIAPGEFLMGSTDADIDEILKVQAGAQRDWWKGEQPQHKIRLAAPFYLGVNEVTQEEFEQMMGRNPSWFARGAQGENQVRGLDTRRFPVERVSWFDAVAFCNKLSEKEHLPLFYRLTNATLNEGHSIASAGVEILGGRGYRLPTEAEWESACRGGRFESLGMRHLPPVPEGQGVRTSRVGSGQPNPFGLFDMQGNVREWCQDWYSEAYFAESPSVDPAGPQTGDKRVQRGGSWLGAGWGRRCEARTAFEPAETDGSIGFRVARNP